MSHLLSPEPSLTLGHLTSALDGLAEDVYWKHLALYMNIRNSKSEHIKIQFQTYKHHKEESLKQFLKSHPAPFWWVVAEALYLMGGLTDNPAYHTALERVVSMYPTGECVIMSIHIIQVLYIATVAGVCVNSTYSSQSGAVYILLVGVSLYLQLHVVSSWTTPVHVS